MEQNQLVSEMTEVENYPTPKYGQETYEEYRFRVNKLVKEGFKFENLNWQDWSIYCKGSGMEEGVDAQSIIQL